MKMAITVNLQSVMKQCALTRSVKLPIKKADKNCQTTNMQPVKPQMDMQSKKPANLQSTYKKKDQVKSICSGKNCQATRCYNKKEIYVF